MTSSKPPDPLRGPSGGLRLGAAKELQGAGRLAIDAVIGVTDMVEAMHRNIASASSIAGKAPSGPASGITGLVYRSVRGVTRVVGKGVDAAFGALQPLLDNAPDWQGRDAVRAALNGVLGDHLASTGNLLAIDMQWRLGAAAGGRATPPTGKLLVLVHGLCMNSRQWLRDGHDHGAALARELGYTPVYLDYNSGLHISTNGKELARQLDALLARWPVPVEDFVIIGHSMGGLVARSACHYAAQVPGHAWLARLRKMIFLGTPHHGAPLERAGGVIDMLLGATPYTAPLARVGLVRSDGIQDLRHASLIDEDWGRTLRGQALQVPLPAHVRCHAVAAVRRGSAQGGSAQALSVRGLTNRLRGDGLVTVDSALGRHPRAGRSLGIAEDRTRVFSKLNHFDLLSSAQVFEQLADWLGSPGHA